MTKRLESYGYPGSTAEVNADGTGLTITVVGTATPEEATAVIEPLTVGGALHFRPVLAGPLAPAPGETASPDTQAVLDEVVPGTEVAGSDLPTTPPEEDAPDATVVLVQPDVDGNVIARWQAGPAQVDATAITDVSVTTHQGSQAVQVTMNEGTPGLDQFSTMASQCFDKAAECPVGVYTVVFDAKVVTAATVRPDAATFTPFSADDLIIWSPDWTEDQAAIYAAIMAVGQLTVTLVPA